MNIDRSKNYAIALGGGGAKGAYEIGVWKALLDAGINYKAVSGTSVGAINGALMVMDDFETAFRLWDNISISQVVNVDEYIMKSLLQGRVTRTNFLRATTQIIDIIKNRGLDISPLRHLIDKYLDIDMIRSSDIDFFITTVALPEKEELEINVKELNDDIIPDMIIASSYLPAFHAEKINGKFYGDGGLQDTVPIHVLVENGYKDIIAVKMPGGFGVERQFDIPDDVNVITIEPSCDLGNALDFDGTACRRMIKIGYYDAKRVIFGLEGKHYFYKKTFTEKEALDILLDDVYPNLTMREILEKSVPSLAKSLALKDYDYYTVLMAHAENLALGLDIDRQPEYKDTDLLEQVGIITKKAGIRIIK